ncbi:polyamine modulated factor 1 binding protein 1 [Turdus rufiventris]|nr:polyamine modulated factor 1 binding protein 1 [Turdus rufiventris]
MQLGKAPGSVKVLVISVCQFENQEGLKGTVMQELPGTNDSTENTPNCPVINLPTRRIERATMIESALSWLSAQCQQSTLQDPQQRRHRSTMITRAKNCIVMSCCCDHILEWELWCLTLKIQDNSRFLGSGGEPEKQTPEYKIKTDIEAAVDGQNRGQRQALVMEPQHGEPRACQDTQQEDLDPDQVLATIQALQLDLDFCRDTNDKQLVQLEELEDVVEQEHQEVAILTQQFQALMDKISDAAVELKDQAVQTEVTYLAANSDFDTSHNIPQDTRELLKQLGAQKESQGLQHSPAQLPEQLGATQAQEQQGLQQLSRDNEGIQGLHRTVAKLQQQVQDMENFQTELAQVQQQNSKQAEKTAAYKTHRQQLHRQRRKMQSFKKQSKQKTCSLQERLQELSSLVQHWQQLHLKRERTLAQREEELVVCKVELAFLKEELSKLKKQVRDTNRFSPIPNVQNT